MDISKSNSDLISRIEKISELRRSISLELKTIAQKTKISTSTLKNIEGFIDRSLINLEIDCIDLLQLHCPPSEICPKKETYEMMDEIVKKGKIANYGVSVEKISEAMDAIQFPNVKSIQIIFNIFRQKPAEIFF